MGFNIGDKTLASRLRRNLEKSRNQTADSLTKLSSGSVFTPEDPRPAERGISEKMEYKIRALSASKRNINDAMSFLQTAESSMTEINNMIQRMKEINIAAASTTVNEQERKYLFIEYEALHDEINRITATTEFNGIKVLDGSDQNAPESLIFRIGDPHIGEFGDEDINMIKFENFKDINTSTQALGLLSAKSLLEDTSQDTGIELEQVEEMLVLEDNDDYDTTYDQAIGRLSDQRAMFGSLQSRFNKSLNFIDVYEENLSAAKSKISDTNYADELSKMVQSKIQSQASTSLLAQGNAQNSLIIQLLNSTF